MLKLSCLIQRAYQPDQQQCGAKIVENRGHTTTRWDPTKANIVKDAAQDQQQRTHTADSVGKIDAIGTTRVMFTMETPGILVNPYSSSKSLTLAD